jgi:hypothetical protein
MTPFWQKVNITSGKSARNVNEYKVFRTFFICQKLLSKNNWLYAQKVVAQQKSGAARCGTWPEGL